jgi:hypothetical protein
VSKDEPDWDAIERAIADRDDQKYIADAEKIKPYLPKEIQDILDLPGARVIPPSEIKQDPVLSHLDANFRLQEQLRELNLEYKSALVMLHGLVMTYGVEVAKGHYKAFVSDEVLNQAPHCITIEAAVDRDRKGHDIHAHPHDCGVSHN